MPRVAKKPPKFDRSAWVVVYVRPGSDLVGVAVFLAAITFSAFEAGRRAEREAIKAAAKGPIP